MSTFDLGLVLVSAALHAVWNVLAKRAPHPLAFLGLLSISWMALLSPALLSTPLHALDVRFASIVAVSAASHVLYQVWLARAYQSADLTVVYPISRSTPAFVALVAVPWLGDRVAWIGAAGIAVVMVGIWLVQAGATLRASALLSTGALYAYLTLAATVVYSLADKLGVQWLDAHDVSVPSRPLFFFALMAWGTGLLLLPYAWLRVPRGLWRQTLSQSRRDLLVSAVFGVASYALILEAMRRAPISYVTCVRQTSVLFAAWLGMRMLGERPSRARWIGSVLVVLGVALIAFD